LLPRSGLLAKLVSWPHSVVAEGFCSSADRVQETSMALRFRIGDMLGVIALVALVVGFFAPELRSWNRLSFIVFVVTGIITAVTLVSFTPVWVVLLMLRRRSRQGSGLRAVDYAAVFVAFLSGLGILIAIGVAIR
jgi:hypothetical protein